MSTHDLSDPGAFRNLDADHAIDRPPISKMAVVAFSVGCCSLLAAFSFVLLPLSIVAIALGAVVLWRISRDASVSGVWLAQFGLGLGIASAAWTVTATTQEFKYLTSQAGDYAKIYLDLVSAGEIYQALELRVPKSQRQIAGTDLEAFYRKRIGEPADRTREVLDAEDTKAIAACGPEADWQFSRGLSILSRGSQKFIAVEMVNRSHPSDLAKVTLERLTYIEDGKPMAMWNVQSTR